MVKDTANEISGTHDADGYVAIDFSDTFSNAVSYASGSWSGDTFVATLSLFGKSSSKTISLSTSINPTNVEITSIAQQGTECKGKVTIDYSVGGKTRAGVIVTNVLVNAGSVYQLGIQHERATYTHLGSRELGYMDHGNFESVGTHDWYYK